MMSADLHAPETVLPPYAVDPERPDAGAEPLMENGALGHTLAEALDAFILDRFSTTLEDPHTGHKITPRDSSDRRT
jgi:hypothetical protein